MEAQDKEAKKEACSIWRQEGFLSLGTRHGEIPSTSWEDSCTHQLSQGQGQATAYEASLAHLQAVGPGSPERNVAHIHVAQVCCDDNASNGLHSAG